MWQPLNNDCHNIYDLSLNKVIALIIFLYHHYFVCHGCFLVVYFICVRFCRSPYLSNEKGYFYTITIIVCLKEG
ncbi:hypothetical protein AERO8C_70656 [Aeromonas veronii]|uniref:Uncharacterized protein n=1 Tax=Aeromonas veronii TaxID=654 RepID=A0A653LDH9_AERVE|nr:hypothetical protein AERO8C_70656 [Aeromonas veronii]